MEDAMLLAEFAAERIEYCGKVEMAQRLADRIFAVGSETLCQATRIQFKGGHYPNNEVNLGGLCPAALHNVLRDVLVNDFGTLYQLKE